jgi:hypothetical protein
VTGRKLLNLPLERNGDNGGALSGLVVLVFLAGVTSPIGPGATRFAALQIDRCRYSADCNSSYMTEVFCSELTRFLRLPPSAGSGRSVVRPAPLTRADAVILAGSVLGGLMPCSGQAAWRCLLQSYVLRPGPQALFARLRV